MLSGLTTLQKLVALALGASLVSVYSLAAVLSLRWLIRKIARRPAPRRSRWRIAAGYSILALALAGLACAAYARLIEPRWIEVTHVRIPTPKLPAGRAVRIVQISDLHCDATFPTEDRLAAAVSAQRPDLIVFTGDATNSPEGLPAFRRCMGRLADIAPVYAIRGNWDYRNGASPLAGTPARELAGEAVAVNVNGTVITLVGFGAAREPVLADARGRIDRGKPLVLLYHYPDEIERAAAQGVDLYLAGHTHGGQVRIPWYGAVITLSPTGKRFEWGLHRKADTCLYVNRGIGMEGGLAPRIRFLARPEVTVIDLVSAAPGP